MVRVWDTQTGERRQEMALDRKDYPWSAAVAPDGKTLVVGFEYGVPSLWSLETGRKIRDLLPLSHSWGAQVLFAPDGRHVVVSSMIGTVYVLRLAEANVGGKVEP